MTDKIHTIPAADNGNDDERSRRRLKNNQMGSLSCKIQGVRPPALPSPLPRPLPPPPPLPPNPPPTYPAMNRRNTNLPIHPELEIILLNVHRGEMAY